MNNKEKNGINNIKESDFVQRIKNIKHIKLIVLLIIFSVVLICIQAYFHNGEKAGTKPVNMTATESRIACMLDEISGISDTEVYINYDQKNSFFGENSGEITGVLVVCKGVNNVTNKLQMLTALQKALNINKDIIEILIL